MRKRSSWPRLAAAATIAAALVVATTATASAVPAGAAASTAPPTLTHMSVSARHLTSGGGKVRVTVQGHRTLRCTLHVRPAVAGFPLVKPCTAQTVAWSVKLPANTGRTPRDYTLTIGGRGAHRQLVTKVKTVTVNPPPAPKIAAVTQSATQLDSTGGPVAIRATVANASKCELTVTPAILGLPITQSCASGAASWRPTLPANPVDTDASYLFTVTAVGNNGMTLTAQRSVTVAAQNPTCPGQTATATPTTSAYFNDPTTNNPQDQGGVVNAMINLICSVSPPVNGVPATIDLGMYEYELDSATQALLWAQEYRSADIHVALDGANGTIDNGSGVAEPNPAYEDLVNGTAGMPGLPAGSVVLCGPNAGTTPLPPPGGDIARRDQAVARSAGPRATAAAPPTGTACAGDNILHTKLLIVSSVDTAGDSAVFTGAQNLNTHGQVDGFNNGLQIVGNPTLYNQNQTYFQHLFANTADPGLGDTLSSTPVTTASGTITDAFFPRNSPAKFPTSNAYNAASDTATDATAHLLNDVSCTAPGDFAGDHSGSQPHTVVQIAMYAYNSRPRITNQLATLEGEGCEVQVLYTIMSAGTLSDLQAAGIQPLQLSDNTYAYPDGSGTARVFIHDKYLLISGGLVASGGKVFGNQHVLVTGSENYTQVALHQNDEQTMEVQQTATAASGTTPLFDAYEADWNHIASVIAALPPPTTQ